MADPPLRFGVILGSLRKASINGAVARALHQLAPPGVEIVDMPSFRNFPIYDSDLHVEGFPPDVLALGDAIRGVDAVVIVSPEYNYSVPGGLKNAIDWVSRVPNQPFAKKPIAIQSASPGMLGGGRMQYHLRQVFIFVDAYVLPRPEVLIGQAATKLDAAGELADAGTRTFITGQLRALAEFTRRLAS